MLEYVFYMTGIVIQRSGTPDRVFSMAGLPWGFEVKNAVIRCSIVYVFLGDWIVTRG
jgi:hypothetical protein